MYTITRVFSAVIPELCPLIYNSVNVSFILIGWKIKSWANDNSIHNSPPFDHMITCHTPYSRWRKFEEDRKDIYNLYTF